MRYRIATVALIWCGSAAAVLNSGLQTVGVVAEALSEEVLRENRRQSARRKAEREAAAKAKEPAWYRELRDVRGDGG